MPEFAELALVCALLFSAGVVKGFFGIGTPPILLGTLTFLYEPRYVLALIMIPIVASNARQAFRGGNPAIILRKHIWFLPVGALSIFGSSFLSGGFPESVLLIITGAAMVLFAITALSNRVPLLSQRWASHAQVAAGAASGLLGGLSGIWGPPMLVYLYAQRLPKAELIQTIGVFFLILSSAMTIGIAAAGDLSPLRAMISVALIVPLFIGMPIGETLRHRLDDTRFLRLFLILFLVLGANLIRRGAFG